MRQQKTIENNIDYVLLAEFDIDKGSTIRHQYPKPCSVSENILADLMLPEGAHLRETDWTYFFLRDVEKSGQKRKRRMTRADKWISHRRELIDNINNTVFIVQVLEFSESVSDWFIMHDIAKVKFVYSGKWALLDENVPSVKLKVYMTDDPTNIIHSAPVDIDLQFTVLSEKELFCSFYPPAGNAVGLKFSSLASLKLALNIVQQVTEPINKPKMDLSKKKEPKSSDPSKVSESKPKPKPKESDATKPLVVLNLVRTQKDDSAKRGAVVKAIAIVTKLRILETFKPLLMLALDDYYRTESEDGLVNLYETINSVSFEANDQGGLNYNRVLKKSSAASVSAAASASIHRNSKFFDSSSDLKGAITVPIKFHGIHMPLTVPLSLGPDEITGVSVLKLFRKFQRHIPTIYNALFTQKRLIFLGHNEPSYEVSGMVLASCLLVSPGITGILYKRAFPYACLTAMQFLQVPGYIAGVTNPIFEQREEWWDVLCNITSGDVKISETYRNELEAVQQSFSKTLANDKQLVAEIKNGLQLNYGEKWLRSVFSDTTGHIVKMALNLEVFETDEQQKHEFDVNQWRINSWKTTESYGEQVNFLESLEMLSPYKEKTRSFERIVRTVQIRSMDNGLARRYFAKIEHELSSEAKIEYFVNLLTPSLGGLYPIMQYLFSKDSFISNKLLDIVIKLEQSSSADKLMGSLNFFYVITFQRLKQERAAGLRKPTKLRKKLNSNSHDANTDINVVNNEPTTNAQLF